MRRLRNVICHICLLSFSAFILWECDRYDNPTKGMDEGRPIVFDESVESPARMTTRSDGYFPEGGSFGVYAYYYENGGSVAQDFMKNQWVAYEGGGTWSYSPARYWPSNPSDRLAFYAYYPFVPTDNAMDADGAVFDANTLTVTYDLDRVNDDVMWSDTGLISNESDVVTLNFKHLLSRICFRLVNVNNPEKHIASITVKNTKSLVTLDIMDGDVSYEEGSGKITLNAPDGIWRLRQGRNMITDYLYVGGVNDNDNDDTTPFALTLVITLEDGEQTEVTIEDFRMTAGDSYMLTLTYLDAELIPVPSTIGANCYMLNPESMEQSLSIPLIQAENGWDKINELEASSGITSQSIYEIVRDNGTEIVTLWKTWEDGELTASIVPSVSASSLTDYQALVQLPDNLGPGHNAVIALQNKEDKTIYWSWHLWLTDYMPEESDDAARNGQVHRYFGAAFTDPAGKYHDPRHVMMDRNLGATITGVTGPITKPDNVEEALNLVGLMYEFGRKDPFMAAATPETIVNSKADLSETVQSPTTYYRQAYATWIRVDDKNLWNAGKTEKSVFDPCPQGWRVPEGGGNEYNNVFAGFGDGNPSSLGSSGSRPDNYNSSPVCKYDGPLTTQLGNLVVNEMTTNPEYLVGGRRYEHTDTESGITTTAWYPLTGRLDDGLGQWLAFSLWYLYSGYWTATTENGNNANSIALGENDVNINVLCSHTYGYHIRCIRE